MNYITFWKELSIEERFKFLAMLDRHYQGNMLIHEDGKGLEILYRAFMFKIREVNEELRDVQNKRDRREGDGK